MKYSIISAARNEEKYISKTLESVVKQSILPIEWVIVNDCSTDKTSELIASYAAQYPWITNVNLVGFKPELKSTGGRVSHVLNIAVKALKSDYSIITKLDSDTEFDSSFFEQLLAEFIKNEKLGIASGHLIFEGKKEIVNYSDYTTRGAVMLIRQEVFNQIGGFFESKGRGEDTLLSISARYYGWETKTFPIFFNHLKPEGSRHSSFHEAYNTGLYKGSIPYRFDYFMLTQLKHLFKKPLIVGSILQVSGYVYSRFIEKYKPFPDYVRLHLHFEQISLMKTTWMKIFLK